MITLKKDTAILVLNGVCLVAVFALVYVGRISWSQAEAFIVGLVLPSALSRKPTPPANP